MQTGKTAVETSKELHFCTTELGIYEACNGFWKLSNLLKTMSVDDAAEMISVLEELTKRNLTVISLARINLQETLNFSRLSQLNFYDASYVIASQYAQATLVTEDKKLCNEATKLIKVISFKQFQIQIQKGEK